MTKKQLKALIIPAILSVVPVSVFAEKLEPLNETEVYGGAGCMIANTKGKALIEGDRIKIDGRLVDLKKGAFTKSSKTWFGKDIDVVFSIPKGKMLETEDGSFTPGTGTKGKLLFIHKGSEGEIEAKEECFEG